MKAWKANLIPKTDHPGRSKNLRQRRIRIWRKKSYKVGDIIKTDITPKTGTNFGRIAAQTAKQVIIQKLREAERNMQFSDFKAKERTLQNGIVQRIEGDTILVDMGKVGYYSLLNR